MKLTLTTKVIIFIVIIAILGLAIGLPLGLLNKSNKSHNSNNGSTTVPQTTINTADLCWMDENASFDYNYINTTSTGNPTLGSLAYSGDALNTKHYKWAYDPSTINYIVLDFDKLNKTYYSGNDLEGLKKTVGGKVIYVANKIITIRSATQSSVLTLKPCSEF